MALQSINLGSEADDGTGDNLRDGGDKINDNFLEIYTKFGDATDLCSGISCTATVATLTAPTITGVVGGTQTSATISTLTTTTVNGATLNATTTVTAGDLTLTDGSIVSSSGAISFGNENLTSTGTLSIGAITTDAVMNINTAVTSGTVNMFLVEGTADDFETTFDVTDPTADRTITFEDVTGTVVSTGSSRLVTGAMIALDTVAEANMADDAIGSDQLKTLVTLLIKNSGGSTLKTIYGAGA